MHCFIVYGVILFIILFLLRCQVKDISNSDIYSSIVYNILRYPAYSRPVKFCTSNSLFK